MHKNILTVVGITILFLGMSINPTVAIDNEKKSSLPTSDGKTLYVGGSGEGNYTRIQDAIDDASDGDTVFVYNGTYYENVVVDKSISLIGKGREITVIDGSENGDVIHVSADWVNITGLTIQNSGSKNIDSGIKSESNFNYFSYNNINYNNVGIYLNSSSKYNMISDNNASNNDYFGIYLYSSSNNTISCNNVSNTYCGIHLRYSSNNIITGNNANSNYWIGIRLFASSYNTVIGNNASNTWYGIDLRYSSNNIITGNNANSNKDSGIHVEDSNNNTITSNNANSNNDFGIHLYSSSYNTVTSNNINSNYWYGIRLFASSNYNTVTDNNANSNNDFGICLYYYSNYNMISGNNASNNGYGIYLDSSSYNTVTSNNASSNYDYGIHLHSSCNNTILGNNVTNNNYGIYLCTSGNNNNIIFHNNFINNTRNAISSGNNIWDDGEYGNYWSDYIERYPYAKPKTLKPWMWNTPYQIGNNKDNCPLINQWPKIRTRNIPRTQTTVYPLFQETEQHLTLCFFGF